MAAKLVELIEATERRGNGTDADPVRVVTGWWTKSGELVVEDDKWLAEATGKRLKDLEGVAALLKCEQFQCAAALNHHLGKEQEEVALSTRVMAAAIGCRKWLEHEAQQSIVADQKRHKSGLKTMCPKPGCFNPLQIDSYGNYSKLCREHNKANAKRRRRKGGAK